MADKRLRGSGDEQKQKTKKTKKVAAVPRKRGSIKALDLVSKGGVKGIAHITGGGFTDNIPRVFPEGLGANIYKDSREVPPVFKWLQEAGNIEDSEMRRTFNMGIGMVLVVSPEASIKILENGNEPDKVYTIGEVVRDKGVSYC